MTTERSLIINNYYILNTIILVHFQIIEYKYLSRFINVSCLFCSYH